MDARSPIIPLNIQLICLLTVPSFFSSSSSSSTSPSSSFFVEANGATSPDCISVNNSSSSGERRLNEGAVAGGSSCEEFALPITTIYGIFVSCGLFLGVAIFIAWYFKELRGKKKKYDAKKSQGRGSIAAGVAKHNAGVDGAADKASLADAYTIVTDVDDLFKNFSSSSSSSTSAVVVLEDWGGPSTTSTSSTGYSDSTPIAMNTTTSTSQMMRAKAVGVALSKPTAAPTTTPTLHAGLASSGCH